MRNSARVLLPESRRRFDSFNVLKVVLADESLEFINLRRKSVFLESGGKADSMICEKAGEELVRSCGRRSSRICRKRLLDGRSWDTGPRPVAAQL